jgi:hypothetical protein
MKNNIKLRITSIVMLLVFCILPTLVHAQPPDPGGDPGVPIDGGLSLLLAAGVGYGVKKIRDHRRKQKEEEIVK